MALFESNDRLNRTSKVRQSWHGVAFLMESMILLLFLVFSLAVLTKFIATSRIMSQDSADMLAAVNLASNTAERFAADPASAGLLIVGGSDGLRASCDVNAEQRESGVMYTATIVVTNQNGEIVYQIDTAAYESEVN